MQPKKLSIVNLLTFVAIKAILTDAFIDVVSADDVISSSARVTSDRRHEPVGTNALERTLGV